MSYFSFQLLHVVSFYYLLLHYVHITFQKHLEDLKEVLMISNNLTAKIQAEDELNKKKDFHWLKVTN